VGTVVERNKPNPATGILQGLKVRRADLVGANSVSATTVPVGPAGNILETLVVPPVLEILCADNTGPATGVNDVVKLDRASAAILARPGCRNRLSGVRNIRVSRLLGGRLEFDAGDLGLVKDLCSALASMAEENLICLRSDDVPGVAFGSTRSNEIGV
jgi:hypothetical protein